MNILVTDFPFNYLELYPDVSKVKKNRVNNFKKLLQNCQKNFPLDRIVFYTAKKANNPILDSLSEIAQNNKISLKLFTDLIKFDDEVGKITKDSNLIVYTDSCYFGECAIKSLIGHKIAAIHLISEFIKIPIEIPLNHFFRISKDLDKLLKTLPSNQAGSDQGDQVENYYEGKIRTPDTLNECFQSQFQQIEIGEANVYYIFAEDDILFELFVEMYVEQFKIKNFLIVNYDESQSLLNNYSLVAYKYSHNRTMMRQLEILEISLHSDHTSFIHIVNNALPTKLIKTSQIGILELPSFRDAKTYLSTMLLIYVQRIHKIDFSHPDTFDIVYKNLFTPLLNYVTSFNKLAQCISKMKISVGSFYTDPVFWLTLNFLHNENIEMIRNSVINDHHLHYLRCRGSVWEVNFGWDDPILISEYLGMFYLAELLRNPGNPYGHAELRVTITHTKIISAFEKESKIPASEGIHLTIKSIKKAIDKVIIEMEKRETQFELKNSFGAYLRSTIDYSDSEIKYLPSKNINNITWDYISEAKSLFNLSPETE